MSTPSPLLDLSAVEVVTVQRVWPRLEHALLPLGIRVFIAILESRCEKVPVCNKQECCNNATAKGKGCPRQMILNEEIQKFVLLVMGLVRRTVRHLDDDMTVAKILRKVSAKHFSRLNLDVCRIDADVMASHFAVAVREAVANSAAYACIWTPDAEAAFASLVRNLICAMQKLSSLSRRDLSSSKDSSEEEMSASAAGLKAPAAVVEAAFPAFDQRLVLFGCKTFQEFFDLHPHVLSHFDQFSGVQMSESVSAADALKMHASRVLALGEDIVDSAASPDKVTRMLTDLGRHHAEQGLTCDQLDMLGPLVCHTIRPIVFKSGMWSVDVEKSWTHLFDMVAARMKRGFPLKQQQAQQVRGASPFPSLTHVLLLRDTWDCLLQQMHQLGLVAVVKLFKINYNLRFYSSPKVRYRPTKPRDDLDQLTLMFKLLVSIVDHVVASLEAASSAPDSAPDWATAVQQMDLLKEPMEWIGPVFCNTVRPLLLVQGRWSYQVEVAWRLLFRHLVKKKESA